MRISQWMATLALVGLLFGFGTFVANDEEVSPNEDQPPQNQTLQFHLDINH